MAYRDPQEALRARVEALEAENRALRRENEALQEDHEEVQELVSPQELARRPFGASHQVRLIHRLDAPLDPKTREHLALVVREQLGCLGSINFNVVGRDSHRLYVGGPRSATILSTPSETLIELRENLRNGTRLRTLTCLGIWAVLALATRSIHLALPGFFGAWLIAGIWSSRHAAQKKGELIAVHQTLIRAAKDAPRERLQGGDQGEGEHVKDATPPETG